MSSRRMTNQEDPSFLSLRNLSLAISDIKAELEQPQAMDGDAREGSAAGHYAYVKLKLSELGAIVELREPHRCHPKTARANLYTIWREVYNCLKAMGQEPTLEHDPTFDMITEKLPGDAV